MNWQWDGGRRCIGRLGGAIERGPLPWFAIRRRKHYISVVLWVGDPAMTLRFTWQAAKAAANLRNHNVSFETAARRSLIHLHTANRTELKAASIVGRQLGQLKAWS